MTNPFRDQEKFMRACDQTVGDFNQDQFKLYIKLMEEEWKELKVAIDNNDRLETLDALLDFIVVTVGAIHSGGYDGDGGWKEVIDINLVNIDKAIGKVRKREAGKVLKSLGWTPPDLNSYLN